MAVDTSLASFNLGGLYRHGAIYEGADGRLYVSVPERLPAFDVVDGQYAAVYAARGGGETLIDVALLYYRGTLSSPVDAWEVLAQFQDDPLVDPFCYLTRGRLLQVPPAAYFGAYAYGDSLLDGSPEF